MRGTPIRQTDFSGGLNTKASPYEVELNECRNCLNVQTNTRGSIERRPGDINLATTFTSGGNFVYSIAPFWVPGSTSYLVAASGANFYKITIGGTVSTITGATVPTTIIPWAFIQSPLSAGPQGPLYGVNGIDTPQQWSGSGNMADWTASTGAVPNGTMMVNYKNRIWIAGVSANPNRLYWSDIGNPRSWPTANVNDFDPADGNIITALGTVGPYLLVFKPGKIYVVYDGDSGANRVLSTGVGCSSPRSVVETSTGTFFLDRSKGIYLTNGKTLSLVSDKITPTILNAATPGQFDWASGLYWRNHYYLSLAVISTLNSDGQLKNDTVLDYDTTTNSWWLHSNAANQYVIWTQPTTSPQTIAVPYATYAGSKRVVQSYFDSTTWQDAGSSYNALWTGPWITIGSVYHARLIKEPYIKKRMRALHVDGNGVVDAYIAKGFAEGATILYPDIFGYVSGSALFGGVGTFGGSGTFGSLNQFERKIYSLGVSRAFSMQFQATSATPFEMDSYTLFYTPRKN